MRDVANWHFCRIVIDYTPVGCVIEVMFLCSIIDSGVVEAMFLYCGIDGCVIETMFLYSVIDGCVIETMFVDNVTAGRSYILFLDSQTLSHNCPPFRRPENNKNASHHSQDQQV